MQLIFDLTFILINYLCIYNVFCAVVGFYQKNKNQAFIKITEYRQKTVHVGKSMNVKKSTKMVPKRN